MSRILWCAGALALAACSQSVESHGAGDETGGLRISVHDLTEADVKEVHIDLLPDDGKINRAPGPLQIILRPTDPGVRDDSGAYVVWNWSELGLPAGAYLISAKAYDVANPHLGFAVLPTFESVEVPTEVKSSPTATVSLFLRQGVEQGDFEPPFVTAIRFDQKPEQAAISRISVWGDGGEGPLSLEAVGPGDLGLRGPPATWDGKGDGNAREPGGAFIDWNPDASGNLALSLILKDGEGNKSTLVLLVEVDAARGDAEFTIAFNHAPWSLLQSDSLVNPPTASIKLTARYGDVESDTALVDFKWDVSDCEDKLFVASPPSTGGVVSGSVVGNEIASHDVTLTLTATPLPDPPPSCEVILEVSDRGLPGDATAVSTSTRSILVTLGEVHPCIGDLIYCGGACVDAETDDDNCGACGNVCGVGQTCTAGACLCNDADLTACGQHCADLQNDDAHCGACGAACGAGLVCEIGDCDFPLPVPMGIYAYDTMVVAGITNPMYGAWHPSGKYALVTEATNRVFKYEPSDASLTEVVNVAGFTWSGVTFSRDGSKAIVYGYLSATPFTSRVYVWDHASEAVTQDPTGTQSGSRYQHHAWSPDGELWILSWNGLTNASRRMLTYQYDFQTGLQLMDTVASTVTSTSPCNRMAWAKSHLQADVIVLLCNSYVEHLYPGKTMMETPTNTGTMNELKGRPQGDYVLTWRTGVTEMRRFENGAVSTISDVQPLDASQRPERLSFSPNGKRALFLKSKVSSGQGIVWEYRHNELNRAEIKDVSIPTGRFPANGWTVHLNDAVWKEGCDEGIILAGNTTLSGQASGYIIEFKVTNGRACPP